MTMSKQKTYHEFLYNLSIMTPRIFFFAAVGKCSLCSHSIHSSYEMLMKKFKQDKQQQKIHHGTMAAGFSVPCNIVGAGTQEIVTDHMK